MAATTSTEATVRLSQVWQERYRERAQQEEGGGCELDEERIGSIVREKVEEAVGPFKKVKKWHQVWDFVQHLVAGTLVPVLGPFMISYLKTRSYARKVAAALDLIGHGDAANNNLGIGGMICESAVEEAVQETLCVCIPLLGPLVAAASLPSRFEEIRQELESKACTLHADWIGQNITPGLLANAHN